MQVDGRLWHHDEASFRFNNIDPPIKVPSISLPAGLTESGLPIGLQLQGTPGDLGSCLCNGRLPMRIACR